MKVRASERCPLHLNPANFEQAGVSPPCRRTRFDARDLRSPTIVLREQIIQLESADKIFMSGAERPEVCGHSEVWKGRRGLELTSSFFRANIG